MSRLDALVIALAASAIIFAGGATGMMMNFNDRMLEKMNAIEEQLWAVTRDKQKETETPDKTIIISINCVSPNQVQEIPEPDFYLTGQEVNELATLVMAEAEGESELGQRLVVDTVLNRVESLYFPETVHGVIYQKGQFSCIWNGRYKRCYPKPELVALVQEELYSRTNENVAFFTAHHYGKYGKPLLSEGHHYFCSYG